MSRKLPPHEKLKPISIALTPREIEEAQLFAAGKKKTFAAYIRDLVRRDKPNRDALFAEKSPVYGEAKKKKP